MSEHTSTAEARAVGQHTSAPESGARARGDDARARISWMFLTEPGDGDAGELIALLGAAGALEAVRNGNLPLPGKRWRDALARWRPRLESIDLDDQRARAAHSGAALLIPGDEAWPVALDELGAFAPLGLWVRGRVELLHARAVAVVGARAATGYGEQVTGDIVAGVVAAGVAVISGGAYGIDGAAHRAALGLGGDTLAVLACGVDRIYPAGHAQLLGGVAAQGLLISELALGAQPRPWRFLLRNRLIAALAEATVVVEAGWRSGSLNTAGHAAALARPLAAVPGPVTSAASAGCHRLLREYDAVCVTCADDVLELIGAGAGAGAPAASDDDDRGALAPESRVAAALRPRTAQSAERIAIETGLPIGAVEAALGFLELDGRASRSGDEWLAGT